VAISTSFEGMISAKSKYKPVNQGFEKYWKSRENGQQNKLREEFASHHSDTGTIFGHDSPRDGSSLVSESAVALSSSIIDS
jgi:hypothetical protein